MNCILTNPSRSCLHDGKIQVNTLRRARFQQFIDRFFQLLSNSCLNAIHRVQLLLDQGIFNLVTNLPTFLLVKRLFISIMGGCRSFFVNPFAKSFAQAGMTRNPPRTTTCRDHCPRRHHLSGCQCLQYQNLEGPHQWDDRRPSLLPKPILRFSHFLLRSMACFYPIPPWPPW
jgi:hypothetical protein